MTATAPRPRRQYPDPSAFALYSMGSLRLGPVIGTKGFVASADVAGRIRLSRNPNEARRFTTYSDAVRFWREYPPLSGFDCQVLPVS